MSTWLMLSVCRWPGEAGARWPGWRSWWEGGHAKRAGGVPAPGHQGVRQLHVTTSAAPCTCNVSPSLHASLSVYCSLPSLLQLLIGCEVDDRLHFENNGYNVLWPIHHFNDKWSVLLCCNAFSELQPYLFSCINCTLHSQHSTVVMLQGIWCKHHYLEFW